MSKTPHVHAELIKAWADGAQIQCRAGAPHEWHDTDFPQWKSYINYRIKPEPKPDSIKYIFDVERPGSGDMVRLYEDNIGLQHHSKIKLTFDGETGKLKAVELVYS